MKLQFLKLQWNYNYNNEITILILSDYSKSIAAYKVLRKDLSTFLASRKIKDAFSEGF